MDSQMSRERMEPKQLDYPPKAVVLVVDKYSQDVHLAKVSAPFQSFNF